jgi:phospholipase/carboxylesterase
MLTHEIRPATAGTTNPPLIVLMHGRGATRFDLLSLGEHMPAHANVIFPEAPFDAAPWGYGPGSAWYRFMGRNRPEPNSFAQSLDAVENLIASFNARTIVIGGFSQGGTMGIGYALSHPGSITGVLNFSGFVADHVRVAVTQETVIGTSFFWGHGKHDPAIPFDLAIEGRALLQDAGASIAARDYDIGHWIAPEELADARAWLDALI